MLCSNRYPNNAAFDLEIVDYAHGSAFGHIGKISVEYGRIRSVSAQLTSAVPPGYLRRYDPLWNIGLIEIHVFRPTFGIPDGGIIVILFSIVFTRRLFRIFCHQLANNSCISIKTGHGSLKRTKIIECTGCILTAVIHSMLPAETDSETDICSSIVR